MCYTIVLNQKYRNESSELDAIVTVIKKWIGDDVFLENYHTSNVVAELHKRELNRLREDNKRLQQIIDNQIPVTETLQQEITELRLKAKTEIDFWKSTTVICTVSFIVSMILHFRR